MVNTVKSSSGKQPHGIDNFKKIVQDGKRVIGDRATRFGKSIGKTGSKVGRALNFTKHISAGVKSSKAPKLDASYQLSRQLMISDSGMDLPKALGINAGKFASKIAKDSDFAFLLGKGFITPEQALKTFAYLTADLEKAKLTNDQRADIKKAVEDVSSNIAMSKDVPNLRTKIAKAIKTELMKTDAKNIKATEKQLKALKTETAKPKGHDAPHAIFSREALRTNLFVEMGSYGKELGIKPETLRNALEALDQSPELRKAIESGKITVGQALALCIFVSNDYASSRNLPITYNKNTVGSSQDLASKIKVMAQQAAPMLHPMSLTELGDKLYG